MKIRKVKTTPGYKKMYFKKKKKFYKKGSLNKRDLKKMTALIKGGDQCECSKAQKGKNYYIIMGIRSGGFYMVTYMNVWLKRDKEFKRALRAMRKGNVCTGGVKALEARDPTAIRATKKRRKNKKKGIRTKLNLP